MELTSRSGCHLQHSLLPRWGTDHGSYPTAVPQRKGEEHKTSLPRSRSGGTLIRDNQTACYRHVVSMGSETGMLGCYWFRGVVFADDGSDYTGKMPVGAGAFSLGDLEMKQCVGVGREEEGEEHKTSLPRSRSGVNPTRDNQTACYRHTVSMGSETGMLGCYWFRGVVFAGDGSNHRSSLGMGAGAFC